MPGPPQALPLQDPSRAKAGVGRRRQVAAVPWGVIADDLTGATDVAAAFVKAGFSAQIVLDRNRPARKPLGTDVTVLSTDSRHAPPRAARRKAAAACHWLQLRRALVIYKKMDSTLQGNITAEVEAIRDSAGFWAALVCPANPAQGRVIRRGLLRVRGVLHGDVLQRISAQGTGSSAGLLRVHRPFSSRQLARLLGRSRFVLADAASAGDLSLLARVALGSNGRVLPAGSAGLAAALAKLLARRRPVPRRATEPGGPFDKLRAGPVVIVCGSANPVTTRQLRHLRSQTPTDELALRSHVFPALRRALRRGRNVILRVPVHQRPERELLRNLRALRPVLRARLVGSWILTGGDTARLFTRWLRPQALAIVGEIVPGLAWGRCSGGAVDGSPVCTKPGGFGDSQSLTRAVRFLRKAVQLPP